MVGEKVLEHLDVTRHHLPLSHHLRVWLGAGGQALAVCNPKIFANQHVASVLCLLHGVFFALHLRDEQQR
jgi:hypothetical protein